MWITRDKNNQLVLHPFSKPYRLGNKWYQGKGLHSCQIPNNLYTSLTWEDEPIEVSLVPTKYVDLFIQENENDYEEYKQEVINTDLNIRKESL